MYSFDYHRPSSIDEALALRARSEEAKFIAGGQTLLPTLKQRLARPSDLIDLGGIEELKGVREGDGSIHIGAMTRYAVAAEDERIKQRIPGLHWMLNHIGDAQVRNLGTVGGSIANNDPAADLPAAVLALNATIHTNKRMIAGDQFFTGMFSTALDEDELIRDVHFPYAETSAYTKFRNPASRYAIVGVFVAKTANGVRVAVAGAGPTAFRVPEMEQALASNFSADAIANVKISPNGLNSDLHASAEYRAHLVTVMAKRAVQACAG